MDQASNSEERSLQRGNSVYHQNVVPEEANVIAAIDREIDITTDSEQISLQDIMKGEEINQLEQKDRSQMLQKSLS